MNRIKLNAYFAKNLGDDLMIHILLQRYPQYSFWVDSASPASNLFLKYPNFQNATCIYRRWGRPSRLLDILTFGKHNGTLLEWLCRKRTKSCKASVTIGGSMFIQQNNCSVQKRIAREERNLCIRPRFVIGANFGPYFTEDFRDAYSQFFGTCQGVTFRDKYSYDLFSQLSCTDHAPDVVLSLDTKNLLNRTTTNTVVISVIDLTNRASLCVHTEHYDSFIRDLCVFCLKNGKTPVLMSFCQQEGDLLAIQRILSQIPEESRCQIQVHDYQGDLQKALTLMADAETIIATRFHSMILALLLEKPFYCISYSNKNQNFLNDLSCNAYCPMDEIGGLDPEMVMESCTTLDVRSSIQDAQKQFAKLDRYMDHR